MKKCINKMLNLQGLLVDKLEVLDEEKLVLVNCRNPRLKVKCPLCNKSTDKVHSYKKRKVNHGILNYRKIVLKLTVRRFKCRNRCCRHVFTEQFPGISKKRSSVNMMMQIMDWLRRNSFNFVAQQFGVSPSTIVRYLLTMNSAIKIDWAKANITKLGIDEHSFRGKRLIITVTDLSNKKLLAILKGDSQIFLEKFILEIPKKYRDKIDEVCTDLRSSYWPVIKKALPQAILTADRFHVERLARQALDEIRQVIQDVAPESRMRLKKIFWVNKQSLDKQELIKLDLIFKRYEKFPILKQAYIIKEQIIGMYHLNTEKEAKEKFKHIMMLLETPEYSKYLTTLRNTLKKWKTPILNYFKHRTTNGFTEGCHTKIKMIKRVSYGFKNIDNYIAKITLAFLPLIWILNYHTF